ncbi:MAG TPA: DUF6600 domain-containing protein, partial [Nitrospiria bacterium]
MKIQSALISIAVLFSLTLPSAAPAMEGDEADFGRISDLTGTLQVKGGYDPDWMSMGVNVPVGEGDSLWLEHGGLAEVEFPGGTRVRMQGESKLDLLELTVFPGAFSLNLEALEGRFYIRTPDQAGGEGIAPVDVKVPSARISIRPESLVRLDIESGRTRVRVQEGSVRIDPFGPGGPTPVFLGRMEQIQLSTEGDPGYPGYFTTASDDGLERYNRFRDNRFMEQDRPEPLDEPLVGQDELARNGSWVFIGGVSYWRPYVSVGWRPYSVGHWAWHTGFGWTWISGDPFGYVTF